MTRLLALCTLATALFFAQPAHAQQHNSSSTMMNQMKMMHDSAKVHHIVKILMNNPQIRRKVMHIVMQKMMMNENSSMHGMKNMPMKKGMMNEMNSDSTMTGMNGMKMDKDMMKMCKK